MGKRQKILGVDPGLSGAFATWDGLTLEIYELPTKKSRGRGREILWDELVDDLSSALDSCAAFVEQVSTRPGEGRSSAFKFGYTAGGFRGILAQAKIPVVMVTPRQWKQHFGISSDKAEAVARAAKEFPFNAAQFYGPRGGIKDGLAEASLIALYGFNTEYANV